MPNKHAVADPLKAAMIYAKAPNGTVFNLGPWPTKGDALEDLQDCEGPFIQARTSEGAPGIWEFGEVLPWTAQLDGEALLRILASKATREGELGKQWAASLMDIAKRHDAHGMPLWLHFHEAVNLVLVGWMAHHEAFPHFGSVANVSRFAWCKETTRWRELCEARASILHLEPCGRWIGHHGNCQSVFEVARHAEEAKHPEIALSTTNPELKTGIEWTEAAPLPGCQKTKDGVRCIWHGTRMQAHTCFFPCQERAFEGILAPRCRHEIGHEGPHDFRCEKPCEPEGQCDLPLGHVGPCHSDDVPF